MTDRSCPSCHGPGDVPFASLGADQTDFAFLTAARYFLVAFTDADHDAWISVILGADNFFPGFGAAEKMRRALAILHEMRGSRRSPFRFSDPHCKGCAAIVTADERHLVQLVQHARAGRTSMMASSAMLLCEGNAIDRVVAAATGFADLLGYTRGEKVLH